MSNENRQGLSAQGERCTSCDGTGDLTRPDGEWVGYCVCPEGEALKAGTALAPELDDQVFKAQRDPLAEVLADLVISSGIDIGDCSLQAGPDLIELAKDLKKRLAALIVAVRQSADYDMGDGLARVEIARMGCGDEPVPERPEQPKRYTADVFYHNHFSTVQMEVVRASHFDEFVTQYDRIVGALRANRKSWEKRAAYWAREWFKTGEELDAAQARVVDALTLMREVVAFHWVADCSEHRAKVRRQVDDFLCCNAAPVAPVAPAGQVPEGWKLVPIEPTNEMWDAGNSAKGKLLETRELESGGILNTWESDVAAAWRAMLAAAPQLGGR